MIRFSSFPRILMFVACVSLAGAASAQPIENLPPFGPDLETLTDAEALDLVRTGGLPPWTTKFALQRAARSGDASLRPVLREIVERYNPNYVTILHNALFALEMLGEPDSYFLANAQAPFDDPGAELAYYSIHVLAQEPDSTMWADIEPLGESSGNGWVQDAVNEYRTMLETRARKERIVDVDSLIYLNLLSVAFSYPWYIILDGFTRDLNASEFGIHDGLDPRRVFARRQLAELATRYPTKVANAIGQIPQWDIFTTGQVLSGLEPSVLTQVIGTMEAYADSVMFEVEVPTLPPANAGADVAPIVECVMEESSGSLVAYFGYDNHHGDAVTIPYGETSVITPTAYDQQQPEVYYMPELVEGQPGRTPFYGDEDFHDWAFAVRFDSTETVSWTLGDRTVTASSSWQRCEDYVPGWQDVTALPSATTLASPTVDASFSGNSFAVSGLDHDLSGNATDSGEDRHGIATADESARQAVLDELSSNQEGNITGRDPAPDVDVAAPGLDVEALVDLLLSRADLITLDADPGNQTVGTATEPVVAYAPDGLDVQGTFEGFGILVVEGTFEEATELRGNASWTGLVIVRAPAGAQAAFDMSGSVEVIGAVVLSSDTGAVLDVGGSSSIRYSAEALQLAQGLLNAP